MSAPMKCERHAVNMLCHRFWPDRHGGVETRMLHASRAMARLGQSVRVITENRGAAPPRETMEPGLEVVRFAKIDTGRLWRWTEMVRAWRWSRVIRELAPAGPLWASDSQIAVGVILAGRADDLVYNPAACVAGMRHIGRAYPEVNSMQLPWSLERMDRWAYRRARSVVVSSDNLVDQFTRYYGKRRGIHRVGSGVETPSVSLTTSRAAARRKYGIAPEAFVAGFVGRLDPCKDLPFLLEAFTRMAPTAADRILIAGDGPDRARLEQRATSLGIADRVVWTGALADPAPAYAAMDVMVLPSVYEAFGLVILEAMAAGRPVIGRRRAPLDALPVLTASDELIRDSQTGYLVAPHDSDHLAAKLWLSRARPDLTQDMARSARRFALDRSWEATATEYLGVLDLLKARARRQAA